MLTLNNWQRIERVVRWAGLSVNSFALSIGLSRGENLYQIKRGNNGISRDLAQIISAKYPQISRMWLLTGEGEMFTPNGQGCRSIPYYDVDVEKYVASPDNFAAKCQITLPTAGDADFGALYNGRAMGLEIPQGAMVLVRRVTFESLIPGGDYVVVTDRFVALRRVRREAGEEHFRLMPLDRDNFDEIHIGSDDVRELYLVCAVLIKKTI